MPTTNNMKYNTASGNIIEVVKDTATFLEHWDFFRVGMEEMNERSAAGIDTDGYLKKMLTIMASWPNGGLVLLKSKNNKLLGFAAGFDATPIFSTKRVLYIYCLYSNGLFLSTGKELLAWTKLFCKQNNFQSIKMETGKIHGGACQYFQKKLGFTDKKLLFSQEV